MTLPLDPLSAVAGAAARSVLRVALLGAGTVGSAVVRGFLEHADRLAVAGGPRLELAGVATLDPDRARALGVPDDLITDAPAHLVASRDVDIVVELMGGLDPALTLVRAALEDGKPVVTANKELIARDGPELLQIAATAGVDLLFEASVAGGIPLIRPLRESLAGDRIRRVLGIVNGTTNFILTRMTEDGTTFADALAEAQRLGYAEADPTADVEGHDAAAKAAIIATIAFGSPVHPDDVYREGITQVTDDDIRSARSLGYVVKLLAVAEEIDGDVAVRVHPAMVPVQHPLASVRDSFNAVFIEADAVGELMLYGRGAGGNPTASAVLGDLVDASRNLVADARGATIGELVAKPIRPMADVESPFYVLLEAADQPGVLAAIATQFGNHGVSIKSMEQRGLGAEARLVFITHRAREADLAATLDALRDVAVVNRVGSVIRVVGEED